MNAPIRSGKAMQAAAARAAALTSLEESATLYVGTAPAHAARSRKGLICAAMAFVAAQMRNAAVDAEEAHDETARAHYQAVAEELIDAAIELGGKRCAS